MIDARIWFLLHIYRMNGQNSTKFCIHIIIDKIFVGILKCHFIFANLQQSNNPRLISVVDDHNALPFLILSYAKVPHQILPYADLIIYEIAKEKKII